MDTVVFNIPPTNFTLRKKKFPPPPPFEKNDLLNEKNKKIEIIKFNIIGIYPHDYIKTKLYI